jgi:hypothetical protein
VQNWHCPVRQTRWVFDPRSPSPTMISSIQMPRRVAAAALRGVHALCALGGAA